VRLGKVSVDDRFIDRSGTIAVGGTSQVVSPKFSDRCYFFFQNISTGDLWLNETGPAVIGVAGNIRIAAGDDLEWAGTFVTNGPINVIGAVGGQAFTCKESASSMGNV
jgi:hypothetical protein